uniref:Uncharacterized LOC110004980 n=1 Tax=Labrus bergylta TaxID=56723 RepID=A0A3Q3F7V1_9LABR|nr:uncharacterized protein LOC110004980 [Labrus bergylta]
MAHTTVCVVVFFTLVTLIHCGHAEDDPRPVVKVSTSWPSPGANVTLKCRFSKNYGLWTFNWYKAVPRSSNNSYSHEKLSHSCSGQGQCSYIGHGQTHTTAYVCKANRGNDTRTSRPTFVWSREIHPNSIKVSPPDRGQHVSSENVSLSCEGNSSKWRVMRLTEKGHRSTCSEWGTMKNSTCDITNPTKKTAVYWCETASGQFSNAVNITFQMSSSEGSSFPLPLVLGLFFPLLTLMLLLLLCCYRKSTNTFVTRIFRPSKSQKTNQSPAADDVVDQNQTQDADESNDVTYSLILFKNRGKGEYSCFRPGPPSLQLHQRCNARKRISV